MFEAVDSKLEEIYEEMKTKLAIKLRKVDITKCGSLKQENQIIDRVKRDIKTKHFKFLDVVEDIGGFDNIHEFFEAHCDYAVDEINNYALSYADRLINGIDEKVLIDKPYELFARLPAIVSKRKFLKKYLKLCDTNHYLAIAGNDVSFSFREAKIIANTYKELLGIFVVAHPDWDYTSIKTIMDVIDILYYDDEDINAQSEIRMAFDEAGFLRACDCDDRMLANAYFSVPNHPQGSRLIISQLYDYDVIKEDNAWIYEELQEYLYHPLRIQKWIEEGNAIEDYLN